MRPFALVAGPVAVLDRPDVDTDQIIPKQFLKRIERTGYGEFLFYDWAKDPDFELNRPEYADARILIAGRNFGCGSSREHAAWALQQAGFAVVVAPSFGDIFATNAVKTGLLTVVLKETERQALINECRLGAELIVDLVAQEVVAPSGRVFDFACDPFTRETLLAGLDEIERTLRRDEEIAYFEQEHDRAEPLDTLALPKPLPLLAS